MFGIPQAEVEAVEPEHLESRIIQEITAALRRPDSTSASASAQPAPGSPLPEPDISFELSEDAYNEDLVANFKKLTSVLASQSKAMKEMKAELDQQRQAVANERAVKAIETGLAKLPKEYKTFIGEGTIADLQPNSIEMTARNNIIAEAMTMAGSGTKPEQWAQHFAAAAKKVLGKYVKVAASPPTPPPDPDRPTPEQWANAGLAVPTERTGGGELRGRALAEYNLAQAFKGIEQAEKDEFRGYDQQK